MKRLLEDGLLIVKRDEENKILKVKKDYKREDKDVFLRYGQLDSEDKINGLGRRIYLREYSEEYYYDSASYDYIDEG